VDRRGHPRRDDRGDILPADRERHVQANPAGDRERPAGGQAFQGGNATAALGLGLHYLIAFIWTVVFYVLASNLKVLTHRPQIIGPLYGTFVWLVMNLVVLPLSSVAHRPLRLQPSIVGAVILMICIGLPMATIIGRHLRR
jgi:uncharacterized membrane protein YagU involved in acid resistance